MRRENHYCGAHDYSRETLSNIGTIDDFRQFCYNLNDRYCWVNWKAYTEHGSVEIRLHSATLEYAKIANWVKAHTRFIDCVANMTYAGIDRLFGNNVQSQFGGLCEVWDDDVLATYYADRAASFGTAVNVPATV